MATFSIEVNIGYLRADNTHAVGIVVFHNGGRGRIKTPYYVAPKQLKTEKGKLTSKIKDPHVYDRIHDLMKYYRKEVVEMGEKIDAYNASQLAKHLEKRKKDKAAKASGIDFIKFGREHISDLESEDRKSYAHSISNTVNSLEDFVGKDYLNISMITVSFLDNYERFLKTDRSVIRGDKKLQLSAMAQSGIAVYMRNVRTLFNAAKRRYNNQSTGEIIIPHYPFEVFKINRGPAPKKRSLEADVILQIRDIKDYVYGGTHTTNRASFARDIFMLSFYLVGMNPADLYYVDQDIVGKRLEYNRKKTRARRRDEAFISIRVEPEAVPLIEKYRDPSGERLFVFHKMYADKNDFLNALNEGLKRISEKLKLDKVVTMYYARHSWSTIARNKCKVSKQDIHEALNHSDQNMSITDPYIEKDWSHIDRANRKVISYLNKISEAKKKEADKKEAAEKK